MLSANILSEIISTFLCFREIIRDALNANDDDVVIFAGNGVTGAIHKLISVMKMKKPPVIFCGPFEHHSNLLPWREMDGQVS